ncbi:protein IMPACT [Notothenia coriiceps]|uniref:Protein IMPACT n=1 Tax=Notothenia coriiceps TaxID=8208 RepID=A0A6I9PVZ5_9TELE|nr:PREDICTED: protein IMPACT [Notothenia coriiceps]
MDDIINPENEGDLLAQIEEVEALSSIYGDEWCVIDEASRIFCIKISNDLEGSKLTACLQIILPPDYPSAAPPIYQINAAWLRGLERTKLANSLEDLYVEHVGESILYLWVEKIREFLVEKSQSSETGEV